MTIKKILEHIDSIEKSQQQPLTESKQPVNEKYMGFKKTVASIKKGGSAENPEAVAAAIGREKYGKEQFQKAAAAGKKLGEQQGVTESATRIKVSDLVSGQGSYGAHYDTVYDFKTKGITSLSTKYDIEPPAVWYDYAKKGIVTIDVDEDYPRGNEYIIKTTDKPLSIENFLHTAMRLNRNQIVYVERQGLTESYQKTAKEFMSKEYQAGVRDVGYRQRQEPNVEGIRALKVVFNPSTLEKEKAKEFPGKFASLFGTTGAAGKAWTVDVEEDYPRGVYYTVTTNNPKYFKDFIMNVIELNPNETVNVETQGVAEGSEDKTAQQRKTERDKQRTTPAQKARNQAQRRGLQQDKDGTYYAKEGVAEGKGKKPDFLDLDKDGNRKESMKDAAKDRVDESWTDFEDAKKTHTKFGSKVTGRHDDYTVTSPDGERRRYITKDGKRKIERLPPVAAHRDDDEDAGQTKPKAKKEKAAKDTPAKKETKRSKKKISEMNDFEFSAFMGKVMLIENEMSDEQKAKKEKIARAMKDSPEEIAGLKKRYGKRWENVVHATATARAMGKAPKKK